MSKENNSIIIQQAFPGEYVEYDYSDGYGDDDAGFTRQNISGGRKKRRACLTPAMVVHELSKYDLVVAYEQAVEWVNHLNKVRDEAASTFEGNGEFRDSFVAEYTTPELTAVKSLLETVRMVAKHHQITL